MLKSIQGSAVHIQCTCDNEWIEDVSNITLPFLEEFGEYENYVTTPCTQCKRREIFNINIPTDDTDEPFVAGDLPEQEETQRYYVRLLMRLCREDFIIPVG